MTFTACGADAVTDDDTTADYTEKENDTVKEDEASNDKEESEAVTENTFLDNNDIYYMTFKGQTFHAGDDISGLTNLGYDLLASERELKAGIRDGSGMALAGDNITRFSVTVYNPTDETIKYADGVLSGLKIMNYGNAGEEELAIEVYGGLKVGSTRADVEAVFGVPSRVPDESYYVFRSSDSDKFYKFYFDENDLVTTIEWRTNDKSQE